MDKASREVGRRRPCQEAIIPIYITMRRHEMILSTTVLTWILVAFGLVFIVPLIAYAQVLMVTKPDDPKTRNIVIGKDQDWRDTTHLRFAYGCAWGDLTWWLPLLVAGSIGVILGQAWGYALWMTAGAISVYISIILWFAEREYVYPSCGPLVYYTIYWGFFVYWGIAVVAYGMLRLSGVAF
jgi:hypothetical protein